MTQAMNLMRQKDANAKARFYAGETSVHPHGVSGKQVVLPSEDGKSCWDTHPRAWQFSEWGNACGATE